MGGACTFVPVKSEDEVQEDDIVFCSVQPGNRIYGQIVKRQWWLYQSWKKEEVNANQYMYTTSNIRGRENVWCVWKDIYGKLVDARGALDE